MVCNNDCNDISHIWPGERDSQDKRGVLCCRHVRHDGLLLPRHSLVSLDPTFHRYNLYSVVASKICYICTNDRTITNYKLNSYILNLFTQSVGYYFQWIIQLGTHSDAFEMTGASYGGMDRGRFKSFILLFVY